MAVKKDQLELDGDEALHRPIELITENGFGIVRVDEIEGASPAAPGCYLFIVRDPRDAELEITVVFAEAAAVEIVLRSRGRISNQSTYWICCAERHLAEYLWEHDDFPPNATLCVELLTPDDLNLARCWDADVDALICNDD